MDTIDIIKLTDQNIEDDHICCAISDKKFREGSNGLLLKLSRLTPASKYTFLCFYKKSSLLCILP